MSASAVLVGPGLGVALEECSLRHYLTTEIYCPDALGLSLTVDQSRTDKREPDSEDDEPDRVQNTFHEVV